MSAATPDDASPARDAIRAAYTMLARRDLCEALPACQAARAGLPHAQGAELLALNEAITHALSSVLIDLGEHGLASAVLCGADPTIPDVQAMADECAAAWQQVRRLREAGVSSGELVGPYVSDWMDPIGSSDWLNRMRLGVPRRQQAKWTARVQQRLAGVHEDEDDDDEA